MTILAKPSTELSNQLFDIQPEVQQALAANKPVLALESTIISHGLPYPENVQIALELENIARQHHVTPATIAVMDGKIKIGLSAADVETIGKAGLSARKLASRDIPSAIAAHQLGTTTVSATIFSAERAGIKVMATGGIGGVHRDNIDQSLDLIELGRTSMIVVSAGAKAILDLPATLEVLETQGVMVVGYQTNQFPAFYSRTSGLKLDIQMNTPSEVAQAFIAAQLLKFPSALLLANPIPSEFEIKEEDIKDVIDQAVNEAARLKISGKAVTPFLLAKLAELTGKRSVTCNLALIRNNVKVACEVLQAIQEVV